MENILIIDLETTGLNPKVDKTMEIGALLYNVKHKVVLQTLSFFLPCDSNPVEHINNIKTEWTNCFSLLQGAFLMLKNMSQAANLVVAHNAQFDKRFLKEIGLLEEYFWLVPWCCSKDDFVWPVPLPRKRLQDVCAAMGVEYGKAHRSLHDCSLLAQCFSKVEDLEARLVMAQSKVKA